MTKRACKELADDLGIGLSTLTRWLSRNRDSGMNALATASPKKIWRPSLSAFAVKMRFCAKSEIF